MSRVKETEFYDKLGVSPDASQGEIKKAFYKAAQQWHPDKNPSPEATEKFKEINEAYEVLSDEQKRETYNTYGKEGLNEAGFHASNPFDFFGSIFGGGFGRQDRGPKRGADLKHPLNLTLADLYKGITKKMKVERNILCSQCKGKGSEKTGGNFKCTDCDGKGVKVQILRRGNFIQQTQAPCGTCQGTGEVIPEGDKCSKCNGKKTTRDSKIIKVEVPRGSQYGEQISFYGEADEVPGLVTGDLLFTLHPKPNDPAAATFKRQGDNLWLEHTVPVVDALLGFSFVIEHLDGRKILAKYDHVAAPGDVLRLEGQGMPVKDKVDQFGDLLVKIVVSFPKEISHEQRKALTHHFHPTTISSHQTAGATKLQLEKVDAKDYANKSSSNGRRQARGDPMDTDDDGGHPQGVQCAQQ